MDNVFSEVDVKEWLKKPKKGYNVWGVKIG